MPKRSLHVERSARSEVHRRWWVRVLTGNQAGREFLVHADDEVGAWHAANVETSAPKWLRPRDDFEITPAGTWDPKTNSIDEDADNE